MSHPDHGRLIMLALEQLHAASQNPESFPACPSACLRFFRTLARSSASERNPYPAAALYHDARSGATLSGCSTVASHTAALLHVYAPGVVIRRRKIAADGPGRKSWGYWVEIADPAPGITEMLAADRALESEALRSAAALTRVEQSQALCRQALSAAAA